MKYRDIHVIEKIYKLIYIWKLFLIKVVILFFSMIKFTNFQNKNENQHTASTEVKGR